MIPGPCRLESFAVSRLLTSTISRLFFFLKVDWPEPFATLSSIFSIAQLNFAEVVPTACVNSSIASYQGQLLCSTLVPIVVISLINLMSFTSLVSRGSAIYWSQLISFVVLPSTSLVLFRFFRCEEFDDGYYLAAQLGVSCESPQYSGFLVYTIVMLLVYPIGVPIYFFATLYPKRDKIRALDRNKRVPRKLRKYEFLFSDCK